MTKLVRTIWSCSGIAGYFLVPPLLYVLHGVQSNPSGLGTYVLLALWGVTPLAELIELSLRREIVEAKLFNRHFQIWRARNVNS